MHYRRATRPRIRAQRRYVQTYRMRRAEHLEPRTSFSRVCLRCSQEPEPVHRPAKAPSQSVDPPCESVGCLGSFPPSDLARVLACLDGASADSASLGEASRWMARPADFCTPVSGSFRRGSSRAVHAGFCDSPKATAAAMRRSASSCKSSAATTVAGLQARKAASRATGQAASPSVSRRAASVAWPGKRPSAAAASRRTCQLSSDNAKIG
jgi:hypothetical protein